MINSNFITNASRALNIGNYINYLQQSNVDQNMLQYSLNESQLHLQKRSMLVTLPWNLSTVLPLFLVSILPILMSVPCFLSWMK